MDQHDDELEETTARGGALSFERAVSAVLKRIKLLVALPVVAAAAMAAMVSMMPNRYDASAIVQIDPRQKSIANLDSVVADLKGDQSSIESEVEIIQSKPIILQVIDTLGLRNDPEFAVPTIGSRLKNAFGGRQEEASLEPAPARPLPRPRDQIGEIIAPDEPGSSRPERDEVAIAFLDRLKVMRVRNTLLIDVRFSASDAVKAARIANTIAEVYLKDQRDSKQRAAGTATQLLEKKIDEMRVKLAEAERRVEQWKASHGIFDTEGQDLSEKQLARLMEQTVIARNATSEAKAKYEHAQKLARLGDGGADLGEVLQSHTVRLFKEQLSTAQRKAAELATRYGARHPEVLKNQAEVAEARSALSAEISKLVANLKNEADVAEARERQLQSSLDYLKEGQIVSKGASIELKELEREATTTKQLFEAMLARYKQTAETQGFQLPDARIIEKADAPLFPASPKRRQMVAIAGGGGLILAIAIALLLELFAPGVSRPEDIERAFEVAHLSSVPSLSDEGTLPPSPAKAVRMIVADPASAFADAIRGARRELDARRTSSAPRIVLISSALPGEGADVFASNLAHHFAMTGGRPLLIDGDLRLQTLTRQLAPGRSRGVLEQLISRQPLEGAILRDGVTGLHFLPAAAAEAPAASVAEALSSDAFSGALASLKQRFDTIIMLAPPLLPVVDARILADHADQIVLAMMWQRTPKQVAKRALKLLGYNERKVSGMVMTDVAAAELEPKLGLGSLFGSGAESSGGARYAA